jgi:glycosyltransferase involved in cell wall biosynthesis
MLTQNNHISVSIVCVAYNHERYIARALDSFLSQQINFLYEIIIAEDCSTDQTLNIVRSYETKFPEIVRVVSGSVNLGAIDNGKRAIESVKGKYIALCDGDDYFIDVNKLQNSYDYMEGHPGCSMVFTPALQIDEDSNNENVRNKYYKDDLDLINLEWVLNKGGGFYPTVTSFYRGSIFSNPPGWLYLHSTGDYPFAILAILKGSIGYIDKVTGCYWKNRRSVSNKIHTNVNIGKVEVYRKYKKNLNFLEEISNDEMLDKSLKNTLIAKEGYMYHAKLANLGLFTDAFKGVYRIRHSLFYKTRLVVKILHILFKKSV